MLRYALYDIRASILSTDRFFFGVALPIVFFLLFGAMQDYSSQPMGDGNVAAYVMIGMALYGAVQNTVAISGSRHRALQRLEPPAGADPADHRQVPGREGTDRPGDFCTAGHRGEHCGHVYRC